MADATKAATDLILTRRVWAVVAQDDDCDDNGKEGDPPVPNNAAAGGGGDNNNVLSADDDVIGGCLHMLNKQTTLVWEALATEKHGLSARDR